MYVKPNIKPELTVEQAGLIIHAIDQLLIRENAGGLTPDQARNLGLVANNLSRRIDMGVAE